MDPGRRAPTTVTMRTPADRFLIYNNPYSLPSVWTPDVRRGQTTYSDLLFRMKCDFGVGGIQLEPSPSGTTEQSGCSRSVLTSHSHTGLSNPRDRNPSMIKYLSTEKGTPEAHPDEREHEPRAPTMLKHYAARMVARAFKVAVLNVDDMRDWLGMVQHCGDLIKLEIWRAILEEGCVRTAVYMWKYNVLGVQDRKKTEEYLEANDINQSGGVLRMGLTAKPYGPTKALEGQQAFHRYGE